MSKPDRIFIRIVDTRGALVSEHTIEKFPCVIGRGKPGETDIDADVALDDPRCSRAHALLERTDEGYMLTDQVSTNGTFGSDGKKVGRISFKNRTRIRVGSHWLELRVDEEEDRTLVDTSNHDPNHDEDATQASLPKVEMDIPEGRGQAKPETKPETENEEHSRAARTTTEVAPESSRGERRPRESSWSFWGSRKRSSKRPNKRKTAKIRPVIARKATSSAFDDEDMLDRAFEIVSSRSAMLGALIFACAHVAIWEQGTPMWKAIVVAGAATVTVIAATLLAAGSTLFSRFSAQPAPFAPVWRGYVTLIAARQLCAWLVYDAALMWPAHRYLEPWVPMVGSALIGAYLCFNLRWIFAFGSRRASAVAVGWMIAMGMIYVPDLRPQPPLWQKIVNTPVLDSQPKRLPASIQVPETQFLHELSESLVTLQEKKQ